MNETWIMKIRHASRLWADGSQLALSRQINAYPDLEEVSQRGDVVTVVGGPATLLHLAAMKARDLELGYVVKIWLEPKEK
jgi:hypothetical protein